MTVTPSEDDLSSSRRQRERFARAAVFAEFRSRDAHAVDYGDFRDRKPNEKPLLPPTELYLVRRTHLPRTRGGAGHREKRRHVIMSPDRDEIIQ